MTWRKIK